MEAIFYSLAKRNNSTKQPDENTARWIVEVDLLEPFSLTAPQIVVRYPEETPEGGEPFVYRYNYCYIGELGARSYFISGWSWANGLWSASLSVDVLGSYALDIGYNSFFVERSTVESNPSIPDALAVNTGKLYTLRKTIRRGEVVPRCLYVLTLLSNMSGYAVCRYALTKNALIEFVGKLYTKSIWDDISVGFADPFKYIVDVRAYPLGSSYNDIVNTLLDSNRFVVTSNIMFGWKTLTLQHNQVTILPDSETADYVESWSYSVTIPKHPQSDNLESYLNRNPFKRISFEWQPVGVIPLDSAKCKETLYFKFFTDFRDGTAFYIITTNENDTFQNHGGVIASGTFTLGVAIPISSESSNFQALISGGLGVTSAVIGAMAGNPATLAAGVSGAMQIGSAILFPQVQSVGGVGSLLSFKTSATLLTECYEAQLPDAAIEGLPLMEYRKLEDLQGGFVSCRNAQFPQNATPMRTNWITSEEREMINQYLNGGFFYE